MIIRCRQHRTTPWIGHVVCICCDRVWKRWDLAPVDCSCGARLLPWKGDKAVELAKVMGKSAVRTGFAGRPCCPRCAEAAMIADALVMVEG